MLSFSAQIKASSISFVTILAINKPIKTHLRFWHTRYPYSDYNKVESTVSVIKTRDVKPRLELDGYLIIVRKAHTARLLMVRYHPIELTML